MDQFNFNTWHLESPTRTYDVNVCALCNQRKIKCARDKPCPECVRQNIECTPRQPRSRFAACMHCIKRKAKCSDQRPCVRCAADGVPCVPRDKSFETKTTEDSFSTISDAATSATCLESVAPPNVAHQSLLPSINESQSESTESRSSVFCPSPANSRLPSPENDRLDQMIPPKSLHACLENISNTRQFSVLNSCWNTYNRTASGFYIQTSYMKAFSEVARCGSVENIKEGVIPLLTTFEDLRSLSHEHRDIIYELVQLKYAILSQSLLGEFHVPNALLEPAKIEQEPEGCCDRLTYIIGELACLKADIQEVQLHPDEIQAKADSVQQKLLMWHKNPSVRLLSESVPTRHGLLVCLAKNQYRCARVAVDLILSKLPETMQRDKDIQTITSNLRHSVTWLFRPRGSVFDRMSTLFLTIPWFMFVLAASAAPSSETKGWVKDILCMIGEKMSIGQNSVILNLLNSDNHTLLRPHVCQPPTEQLYLVKRIEAEGSTKQLTENTGGEAASQGNPESSVITDTSDPGHESQEKRGICVLEEDEMLKKMGTEGKSRSQIVKAFGGRCRLRRGIVSRRRSGCTPKSSERWSPQDVTLLIKLRADGKEWDEISAAFGGKRTAWGCRACHQRYFRSVPPKNLHLWQPEEDKFLHEMRTEGKTWSQASEAFGGKRTADACKLRYHRLRLCSKSDEDGSTEMPLGGIL